MIRSGNPALRDNVFRNAGSLAGSAPMTVNGTVNKTGVLLLIVIAAASWTWNMFLSGSAMLNAVMIGGMIGGFIAALVCIFKKEYVAVAAPVYAACQGLAMGGVSSMLEAQYPGVVIQAVGLTFGTLFCLLGAYKSGIIQATENFKLGLVAATGGIFVVYLVGMVLGFFGIPLPLFGSGNIGIGFSLVVVVIAALNLVMDFDFIERGAEMGAPKYMEWYGAFGLMVTLIWLYMEILRLLVKLRQRD